MSNIEGIVGVDGATGYMGSHLIARLTGMGVKVRALTHAKANADDLEVLKSTGAQVVNLDLAGADVAARTQALAGLHAVVHLIGSVAPRKGVALSDLHVNQTDNLIQGCKQANVQRLIVVTTLGARADADNSYQATKSEAEKLIVQSGLNYTILRPPLIVGQTFGRRDSKLVRRYREIILHKKLVPLINGGKNKLQPLFIGDLIEAICLSLGDDSAKYQRQTLDLGGPEVMTMRQFVELLMDSCRVHKPILALPPSIASLLAAVCEMIQDVPTVSSDQVKLATADNICVDNALTNKFNLQLTPVKSALESYNNEGTPLALTR